MNKTILAGLLLVALALGACDKQTSLNAPTTPATTNTALTNTLGSIALTPSQAGELLTMFYLGEDLSPVAGVTGSGKMSAFVNGMSPNGFGGLLGARHFFDMAAVMYFHAALKANADISDTQKADFQTALAASNQRRFDIVTDTTLDRAAKDLLLQAEHVNLMAIIKGSNGNPGVLTAEQVRKTEDLLAQIEAQRRLMHQQMLEKRIRAQIAMWDKVLIFTIDQKDQIAELLRQQDTDIEAARGTYKGDPEGFRTALETIQAATNDAIRALLTDAQKVLWDQLLQNKWPHDRGGHRHGPRH